MKKLIGLAEISMLVALAVIGMILLPLFCLWQAIKGNPLWFVPRFDRESKR